MSSISLTSSFIPLYADDSDESEPDTNTDTDTEIGPGGTLSFVFPPHIILSLLIARLCLPANFWHPDVYS